jgi:hypothetical protein
MLENNVRIIKPKVDLLNLAEEIGNVSRACKTMDLSRHTFYRYLCPLGYTSAVEQSGIGNPLDKSRRQPNLKNRVDELTEQSVLTHAINYPAHGQLLVSNELRKAGDSYRRAACAVSGYVMA